MKQSWVRGEQGGVLIFVLNVLTALPETSPKSTSGSNLGAPCGLLSAPKGSVKVTEWSLEPDFLSCASRMRVLGCPFLAQHNTLLGRRVLLPPTDDKAEAPGRQATRPAVRSQQGMCLLRTF